MAVLAWHYCIKHPGSANHIPCGGSKNTVQNIDVITGYRDLLTAGTE
jgi:hypothetical protein